MQIPAAHPDDWRGWNWPVPITNGHEPVVTDGFFPQKTEHHRQHQGVDIAFRRKTGDPLGLPYSTSMFTSIGPNTSVVAAGPGKIWVANLSPRGHQVLLDHGKHLNGCCTYYQHLSKFDKRWKKGDVVQAGDVLGLMGGDVKPGAYPWFHLHFEIWFPRVGFGTDAWKANPALYMKYWRKITR